ncbi:unnamed protein product [Dovyalis caffra]|uniref:Uncharacterized protein n=1 Tax=Dovyalis caffra TaxID=77055 RepID=A0AAV1RXB2_9ROSI|nr:unnamed protein product [Dovyalis caffra]
MEENVGNLGDLGDHNMEDLNRTDHHLSQGELLGNSNVGTSSGPAQKKQKQ